jgi:hypothetical protein
LWIFPLGWNGARTVLCAQCSLSIELRIVNHNRRRREGER